jgi:hypothetical protein
MLGLAHGQLNNGEDRQLNEWGFAAEIKSWWDAEFKLNPRWGFARCEVEKQTEGSRQRSDLSVLGAGVCPLSGELRLPDHPKADPWHPDNLEGAIEKARRAQSRWCFTSDGVTFLLIDVERGGAPLTRVVQSFDLFHFEVREQLDSASLLAKVRARWTELLVQIAPIVLGQVQPAGLAPDERFINALRALLTVPVSAIRDELDRRRQADSAFEISLVKWMVDEQGWTHDVTRWEDEILRTARLTAYVFATRLMFYMALRRSQPTLPPLVLPEVPASVAQAMFKAFFDGARKQSGDYETVFAIDQALDYALCADASVAGWRRVLEHLSTFDLAHIGYDIAGKLFERLIDPHERYRWGQHYTQPAVVDLMLSFAIPDGRGAVLDPATGGGTFLVRAYVRKHLLLPELTHQQLLADLYGFEVSALAANLATINLAVRSLEFDDNYPRIVLKSFFRVRPAQQVMSIPGAAAVALGPRPTIAVSLPSVRAVACNPPYIRLQSLSREQVQEADTCLRVPVGRVSVPPALKGASNYHLYFWLHGAQFLEPGGRLVLITSGEWLDSDYGVLLQEWLLNNFEIECLVESMAEPWFSEARVGTVVVSARLCTDPAQREANLVRFVQLRRPLRELYGEAPDELDHLRRVDAMRDRLLAFPLGFGESDDMDWSVVKQESLRSLGTQVSDETDA